MLFSKFNICDTESNTKKLNYNKHVQFHIVPRPVGRNMVLWKKIVLQVVIVIVRNNK